MYFTYFVCCITGKELKWLVMLKIRSVFVQLLCVRCENDVLYIFIFIADKFICDKDLILAVLPIVKSNHQMLCMVDCFQVFIREEKIIVNYASTSH